MSEVVAALLALTQLDNSSIDISIGSGDLNTISPTQDSGSTAAQQRHTTQASCTVTDANHNAKADCILVADTIVRFVIWRLESFAINSHFTTANHTH